MAFHAFHFAEEDGVIAGWMFSDYVARQLSQCTVQERNAAGGPAIANAEAGMLFRGLFEFGEILGERLLVFAQNADAKAALRFHEREKQGFVRNADENEKWVQRNRGEGIGGHAMDYAGVAFHGNHGDARGEGAGDFAKRYGIERRDGHGAYFSR